MANVIEDAPIHPGGETAETNDDISEAEQRALDSLDIEDEAVPDVDDATEQDAEETAEGEDPAGETSEADEQEIPAEPADDPQLLQLAMYAGLGTEGYEKYKHNPAMIHAAAQGVLASRQPEQTQTQEAEEAAPTLEINEEDFDPELVKVLRHLQDEVKTVKAENADLRQGTQANQQQQQVVQQQAVSNQFDGFVDKLNNPKLGKGSYAAGTLGDKFVTARQEIYETAEALLQNAQSRGRTLSQEDAWKRAATATGYAATPKPTGNQKRRNASLNQGSYGESGDSNPTDEEIAFAAIDNRASEKGYPIE